jgi:hypothetical protein
VDVVGAIGTIAVVVSVLVLAYQGRELARNTRIANEVAGTQAHRELMFHWKSVTDVFLTHPELHRLYHGDTSRVPTPDDTVRLDVIAEQHADWLDTTLMTEKQLGSYLYSREYVGGWRDFAADSVFESPALRSLIRKRPDEWPTLASLVAEQEASRASRAPEQV